MNIYIIILIVFILLFLSLRYKKLETLESFSNNNNNQNKSNDFKYFYINLEKEKDKRINADKNQKILNIPINRFNAVNGKDLTNNDINFYVKNSYFTNNFNNIKTRGQVGVALSHIKLLEKCSKDNKNYIIFEDDFIIDKTFKNKFEIFLQNLPNDWDIFYLFINDFYINDEQKRNNNTQRIKISKHIYKPIKPIGLVAYGVNCKSAELILKHIKPLNDEPIDDTLGNLIKDDIITAYTTKENIVDHPHEYYSNTFEKKLVRKKANFNTETNIKNNKQTNNKQIINK
jgi:GR25 family glycosyltransferase involved in LPS biosynthesis